MHRRRFGPLEEYTILWETPSNKIWEAISPDSHILLSTATFSSRAAVDGFCLANRRAVPLLSREPRGDAETSAERGAERSRGAQGRGGARASPARISPACASPARISPVLASHLCSRLACLCLT